MMGKPRFTHDVDLTADVDNDDIGRFFEQASQSGFDARVPDPVAFAQQSRMLLLVHRATHIAVDIAIAGLPFEFDLLDRAVHVELAGLDVPVAAPDDLIIMKAVAGRPNDLDDIRSILDSHPDLDLARVRSWLSQFAEALDAPDILQRFEEIVADWRRGLARD